MKDSSKNVDTSAKAAGNTAAQPPRKSSGRCTGLCVLVYRLCVALLAIALVLIAYCTIIGIPSEIIAPGIRAFNEREQLGLAVETVRFYPPDTVWLRNLRVEGSRLDNISFFTADDCWLKLDWRKYRQPFEMIRSIHVENGTVNLHVYRDRDTDLSPATLSFTDLDLRAGRTLDGWRFKSIEAKLGKMDIKARGDFHRAPDEAAATERDQTRYISTYGLIKYIAERGLAEKIEQWHREYANLRLSSRLECSLDFEINSGASDRNRLGLEAKGEALVLRDVGLENLRVSAEYKARRLEVKDFSFDAADGRISGEFAYGFAERSFQAGLSSSLSGPNMSRLAPSAIMRRINSYGFRFNGPLELELGVGPVAVDRIEEVLSCRFKAGELFYRDLELDSAAGEFVRAGPLIRLRNTEIVLGEGILAGDGEYDITSRRFSGSGRAEIDPARLLPLIRTPRLREVVESIKVADDLVVYDGTCAGTAGEDGELSFEGRVAAKNFSYNSVDCKSFESDVVFANSTLAFNDFELIRPEGMASGRVFLDIGQGRVDYNAVSGCDPEAVVGIIDPSLIERLRLFEFDGPVQVSSGGEIDLNDFDANSIEATVSARNFSLDSVAVEQLSCQLALAGRELELADVAGEAFGGSFSGRARMLLEPDSDFAADYWIEANIANAGFDALLAQFRERARKAGGAVEEAKDYGGTLNMDMSLEGRYADGSPNIATGEYTARIDEGRLFQIRLLGGLSRYLSKLIPGFGYLSQTELRSEGMFRPDRVLIQDVELRGGVVTVKGHGDYYYNHDIAVDVQVVPLREGVVANLMRVVMFPVSKLFEFRLTGTLEEPDWRPKNLPKQLFLKFD